MSAPQRNSRGYLRAHTWLATLIGAIIRPRPRTRLWKWLDQNVNIPEASGGPRPGRLRTKRFPIFRGLYDLAQQRQVHFLTLCSSARAGKTLFCICLVLYWIAERFGSVVWLDPTRNSARKLVREELDDFMLGCEPVREKAVAAPPDPGAKKWWTTLEKAFRGKRFRIVGSGAEADLHGFNAELAIINEFDACRPSTGTQAASAEKIEARTALFGSSRLIAYNSTPQAGECGPTWQRFLSGSQHHCYIPCPACSAAKAKTMGEVAFEPPSEEDVEPGRSPQSYDPRLAGWQRFTFSIEKKPVPFDVDLNLLRDSAGELLPRNQWREEITGQASFERFAVMEERPSLSDPTRTEPTRVGWRMRSVRTGTTYQCAYCQAEISQVDRGWMLDRYRWVSHNPQPEEEIEFASDEAAEESSKARDYDDHISAHLWCWYSPFEEWGDIAVGFLKAKGNLGRLLSFYAFKLGKPLPRDGSAIKSDDLDRVIGRSPVRYLQGQLPREAEVLTVTIDKQGTSFWFVIRAWGVLWDHPEWPTWSALVDWGEAASWKMIMEKCGRVADDGKHLRRFRFGDREYMVTVGLVDCGFEQQAVFDLCLPHADWMSPSKGADGSKTGFNPTRPTDVMDNRLQHIWFWSDHFAAELYWACIKDGAIHNTPVHWWLPTNLDEDYRAQLCDEYFGEKDGKRKWLSRTDNNHLGDCEKNQRVIANYVEETLDRVRDARAEEEAIAHAESAAA